MYQWISVKDRLPVSNGGERYLVWNGSYAEVCWYYDGDDLWINDDGEFAPSHWMNLPESPEVTP